MKRTPCVCIILLALLSRTYCEDASNIGAYLERVKSEGGVVLKPVYIHLFLSDDVAALKSKARNEMEELDVKQVKLLIEKSDYLQEVFLFMDLALGLRMEAEILEFGNNILSDARTEKRKFNDVIYVNPLAGWFDVHRKNRR